MNWKFFIGLAVVIVLLCAPIFGLVELNDYLNTLYPSPENNAPNRGDAYMIVAFIATYGMVIPTVLYLLFEDVRDWTYTLTQ